MHHDQAQTYDLDTGGWFCWFLPKTFWIGGLTSDTDEICGLQYENMSILWQIWMNLGRHENIWWGALKEVGRGVGIPLCVGLGLGLISTGWLDTPCSALLHCWVGSGNKAESSGGNRSEEGGEEIIGGEILSSDLEGSRWSRWSSELSLARETRPQSLCSSSNQLLKCGLSTQQQFKGGVPAL